MTYAEQEIEQGTLRFGVAGGMSVRDVRHALGHIERAYNGLVAIDIIIASATTQRERYGEQPFLLVDVPSELMSPSSDSSLLVPPGRQLVFGVQRSRHPVGLSSSARSTR